MEVNEEEGEVLRKSDVALPKEAHCRVLSLISMTQVASACTFGASLHLV